MEQITDLIQLNRFDYIVIEASGICEPEPIAQTICSIPQMNKSYTQHGICHLDCIVTVVDALRLQSEFDCGGNLTRQGIEEEDIENLIIQQIEFCNIILLNKASEVQAGERNRIKQILHTLQPQAEIIECDYAKVDLGKIIHTGMFDFEKVATSATWIQELEGHHHEEAPEGHEHHHEGHHHHHEGGEVEEYGIGTFVYYRRPAFDFHKFNHFVSTQLPRNVIRAKGICYFNLNRDKCYLFEQAGSQKQLRETGLWYAAAPEEDLVILQQQDPDVMNIWDQIRRPHAKNRLYRTTSRQGTTHSSTRCLPDETIIQYKNPVAVLQLPGFLYSNAVFRLSLVFNQIREIFSKQLLWN